MKEDKFIRLQVGEKFPFDIRDVKAEGATWRIVRASFDVVVMLQNARESEIQDFRKGEFRYGVVVLEYVPVFLVKFGRDLSFELFFNILLEKENGRDVDTFLDNEANLLTLFLVEPESREIKAMRAIGLDLETPGTIKEACREQMKQYKSAAEVAAKIDGIIARYSHNDLLGMTYLKRLPKQG